MDQDKQIGEVFQAGGTRRQLSSVRREAATQEVLDIAAACRRRRN